MNVLLYSRCLAFCHLFLVANSMLFEELGLLFSNKRCIEASLASISSSTSDSIMMDSVKTAEEVINSTTKDYKSVISKINELAQYNDLAYMYKLISEDGPPHARMYTVKLILGDEDYEGTGSSLQKAKQAAAVSALENTFFEHPPKKISSNEEKPQTPTVVLNNIATKLGISVSYYLLDGKQIQTIDSYGASDEAYGKTKSYYQKLNNSNVFRVPVEEPNNSGPFTVEVNVLHLTFRGIGHTVQAARHDAAAMALQYMEKQALFKDDVCSKEESVTEYKKRKENLKSPISRIYEVGQKHNLPVEFNIISESGKPHKKVFIVQCKLGSFTTEGEGHSKQEARKKAAEEMLKYLPYLPEIYNENAIVNGLTNKKKNKKKKKIKRDNNDNLVNTVSQMASSLWGGGDNILRKDGSLSTHKKTDVKKGGTSAKDKILEIGNKLNIPIEFIDASEHGDKFYALVSVGLKPPHVCLGKATTRELSHENAASHAILFLHKSGVFEKVGLKEFEHIDLDEYYFENEVVHKSFEDVDESK